MSDPLVTYLEDHKAGAGLAIGLLQAMEARHDCCMARAKGLACKTPTL